MAFDANNQNFNLSPSPLQDPPAGGGEASPIRKNILKPKYIVILVLILLASGLVFWKLQKDKAAQKPLEFTPKQNQAASEAGLGAQVYEQTQNPVKDQVPEGNPFNENETNPIGQSYKNPFE